MPKVVSIDGGRARVTAKSSDKSQQYALWSPYEGYLCICLVATGFPRGPDGNESACNVGDLHLITGSERSPTIRNGYPLQYSCLETTMDREAWKTTPHGIAESDRTQ